VPRGGKRPGAGRKPGSATKRTREIADQAAASGLTPLEVMLRLMRRYWRKGQADRAAAIAKDAAPYVHPRLSSTDPGKSPEALHEDDLDELK